MELERQEPKERVLNIRIKSFFWLSQLCPTYVIDFNENFEKMLPLSR